MRDTHPVKASIRFLSLAVGVALALGVGGAAPARAEPETGVSLVMATDPVMGTVTLEGGRVYRVTASTWILDASGRKLGLSQVPVAHREGPLAVISPEATVRYEADVSDSRRVLYGMQLGDALSQ